jgi:hypothetical protein
MAVKRISAETLIELAVATLNTELAPHLPAERRYTVAMIANALDIARRDIIADGEAAGWSLLDELYPEGDGTMERLAQDIRGGGVNDVNQPELRKRLHAIVVAELKVRNPKFLARRGYKG